MAFERLLVSFRPERILFDGPELLVVDKPSGVVVHGGDESLAGDLVSRLRRFLRESDRDDYLGVHQRLDTATSGVLLFTRRRDANRAVAGAFEERRSNKEYVALVWGVVQAGRRIDLPIGRDPNDRQKMSARARRARSAVTRITFARHLRGVTLCHVAIHTGRTHQIRVHLSAIGHPIVGDATYGGVKARVAQDLRPVLRLDRPFLIKWLDFQRVNLRIEFVGRQGVAYV